MYYRYKANAYINDLSDTVYLWLDEYPVVKKTPKGAWIHPYGYQKPKFILDNSKKKWAYPSKEEAYIYFRRRTEKHYLLVERQLKEIKTKLDLTPEKSEDLRLDNDVGSLMKNSQEFTRTKKPFENIGFE